MKVQLPTGSEIRVDITHIHPNMDVDDIKSSPYRVQAVKFLGSIRLNGTVACISENGRELAKGKSVLHTEDNFEKHKGVCIALSRALDQLSYSKEERKAIWNQVFGGKYNKEVK